MSKLKELEAEHQKLKEDYQELYATLKEIILNNNEEIKRLQRIIDNSIKYIKENNHYHDVRLVFVNGDELLDILEGTDE